MKSEEMVHDSTAANPRASQTDHRCSGYTVVRTSCEKRPRGFLRRSARRRLLLLAHPRHAQRLASLIDGRMAFAITQAARLRHAW